MALVLVAWLLLGGAWAVASPPGSSPDDDFHLGSIWCAWGREATGCVVEDSVGGRSSVLVPALQDAYSTCLALRSEQSAACQFDGERTPLLANRGGYPPGFYAVLRIFATDQASASVVVMRMAVWVISSAMWGVLFALIPARSRYRMLLAALVGAVPLGLFIAASTNPSAALITGVPVAALAAAFAPPLRTARGKVAMLLAVGAALSAVLSRSDAPFLLGVAALGAAVAGCAGRSWRHSWPVPAAVLAVAVMGLAFGGSQAQALTSGLSPGEGAQPPGLVTVLQQLPIYFVGQMATTLGYMDVPMPPIVWASIAAAFAGVVLLGLWSWSRAKGLAIAVIVAGQLAGLVFLQTNTACCTIQPRYFLPLTMTWLVLAASVPPGVRKWRLNRAQAALLWALITGAQALALRQVLERYTTGLGSPESSPLLSDPQWWWNVPVPPFAIWLLGSLSFAAVAFWVLAAITGDRPPRGTVPDLSEHPSR